jgi:diguanylate cyclase (GGDEF)-like protein/PAS domain S-box-containing protein
MRATRGERLMEKTLQALLESLPLGVLLLDRGGRIVLSNPAAIALLGLPADALIGRAFFGERAFATELRELEGAFFGAMADETTPLDEDREFSLSAPAGPREVRVRLRRVLFGDEHHALFIIDDNERVKRTERALAAALGEAQDQAVRDPLTGLFNRRHIEWVLPAELKRAERHDSSLALMVIDLDHFKLINDQFGHPMGDRVLIELARLLNRILRVGDTCARVGGEEFCVVLPHSDVTAALRAADRLHRVFRALRIQEEPALRVTASIGIATVRLAGPRTDFGAAAARLMSEADRALYAAKNAGRDRTEVASA